MLFFFLACTATTPDPAGQVDSYIIALDQVARHPTRAIAICAPLTQPTFRGDCFLVGAAALAKEDGDSAMTMCNMLEAGIDRDECGFVAAESSNKPHLCSEAGVFEDDCRLHLLQQRVNNISGEPGTVETKMTFAINQVGFQMADSRVWTLLYRHILSQQEPLNRDSCKQVPPQWRASCRMAGLGIYEDRLNYARDAGMLTEFCATGAVPEFLAHAPDPELTILRKTRQQVDLCR